MDYRKERLRLIAARYEQSFRGKLSQARSIGREAEYPVVWRDGSAADVRLLLAEMARQSKDSGYYRIRHEGGFDRLLCASDKNQLVGLMGSGTTNEEVTLEVGWGTIECAVGPFPDLFSLQEAHEDAMSRVISAADALGMLVLGYGIQPRTPPSLELMSPRNRYAVMHEAVGNPWLWFTVTAADQTHVDVERGEMIEAANIANLLSPIVISLCANSPIHKGRLSKFSSAREGHMQRVGGSRSARHGQPKRQYESYIDLVEQIAELPFLMKPIQETSQWQLMTGRSFQNYLSDSNADFNPLLEDSEWESFLAHDHYVWHSARPRVRQGTIELRAACQQPWEEHMAAQALNLGLVESWKELHEYVIDDLFQGDFNKAWKAMVNFKHYASKQGLQQPNEDDVQKQATEIIAVAKNGSGDGKLLEKMLRQVGVPKERMVDVIMAACRGDDNAVKEALAGPFLNERSDMKLDDTTFSISQEDLINRILTIIEGKLFQRGFGEEKMIQPLFRRHRERENPAQTAIRASKEGGMQALLDHAAINKSFARF
eukprot:g1039.t1